VLAFRERERAVCSTDIMWPHLDDSKVDASPSLHGESPIDGRLAKADSDVEKGERMFKTAKISVAIALFAFIANQSRGADNTSSRIYQAANTNAASKDVDNTGQNVRDRSNATVTPGDQANNKADVETTRRIRRALTQSDQLSTTAKNIKIITANGKVTLRGPVATTQEQQTIVKIAKGVAGDSSVDNQLEVKNFK
jgi:osmotically-inducible protein OsmY